MARNIAGETSKNCRKIKKASLNSGRNSTVAHITSGRKATKRETDKKKNHYTGDSNIVTQPSSNPAEQGLTLLSRREGGAVFVKKLNFFRGGKICHSYKNASLPESP